MQSESNIYEDGKNIVKKHGKLLEIICLSYPSNILYTFSNSGTISFPKNTMFTFGYHGTGSKFFTTFLNGAGFNVSLDTIASINAPMKLKEDGTKIRGQTKKPQWIKEFVGQSLEEAKEKTKKAIPDGSCIISEEILCDGVVEAFVKTLKRSYLNDEEAKSIAKDSISYGSELISFTVTDKEDITEIAEFKAYSEKEANEKAKSAIHKESSYKSLSQISCVQEPKRGFLGIGKQLGNYEAEYTVSQKELKTEFRRKAKIKVSFGPDKLKCKECGKIMRTSIQHVYHTGGAASTEAEMVKLLCNDCNITRIEKRYEVEGNWIVWEDGSAMPAS
jgi:hypothetical protein